MTKSSQREVSIQGSGIRAVPVQAGTSAICKSQLDFLMFLHPIKQN